MHLRRMLGLCLLAGMLVGCTVNAVPGNLQATGTGLPVQHAAASLPAGEGGAVFTLQLHSPSYLPAFTQPEAGCNWVGVAGQVLDSQSLPVVNVAVVVKGKFNSKDVYQTAISGSKETYGPGGYEIRIGEQAEDTQGDLAIQLLDEQDRPLSKAYPVTTYRDCQKNLILYNFQASKTAPNAIFIPFVTR